ncbi:unnamed protein product [Penicillium salamii]|uniref:Uncharacterized protein n=1 Tax=Penicillium salamii TaxID=1612424 RepID=A0A9W4JM29_9EURO|nr:unnamed protein product [Penicillium salamii]
MILLWLLTILAALDTVHAYPARDTQIWVRLRENVSGQPRATSHPKMNQLTPDLPDQTCHLHLTLENPSCDNIAGYWDFHPDIDNLRIITFCNDYTNPNWTVYGEPLDICADPYSAEVPVKDPDHNFGGVTYEIFRKWNVSKTDVPNIGALLSASRSSIISVSTRVRLIRTASLLPRARPVASLTMKISLLVSGTMSPEQHARFPLKL